MGGERRRRLIHRQDPRFAAGGFGDLDHLPLGDRQSPDQCADIERHSKITHDCRRVPAHSAPVNPARREARLAAQVDVLGDGEMGGQI